MDALSSPDRLKMEEARSIREDYLNQNAFLDSDTYTSLHKQLLMMKLILAYYDEAGKALEKGASIEKLVALPVREPIGRFKYTPEQELEGAYQKILADLATQTAEAVTAAESV
jgi:V/A-type H+-transporting ATPase subunit A